MKSRLLCLTVALILSSVSYGQSLVKIQFTQDSYYFSTEEQLTVYPENIIVTLTLQTSANHEDEATSHHTLVRQTVFEALDKAHTSYQGQPDEELTKRKGSGFHRAERITTSSNIFVTVYSDKQLKFLAQLIEDSSEISLVGYEQIYPSSNSVEEIEKKVIQALLSESEKYQRENDFRLRPLGISELNIESEDFGENVLSKLMEDNRIPEEAQISSSNLEITGIRHTVVAELSLRRVP